jgi:hypothetical protein
MASNVTGKLIGGRRVRWDGERAADAYARGWWVRGTLADSLVEAAQRPHAGRQRGVVDAAQLA